MPLEICWMLLLMPSLMLLLMDSKHGASDLSSVVTQWDQMRLLPLLLCKSVFSPWNENNFRNTLDAALAGVEDIGLSRSLVRRLAHLDEYLMQYVFVFESFLDTNELSYEIYTYAVTKVRFYFPLERSRRWAKREQKYGLSLE